MPTFVLPKKKDAYICKCKFLFPYWLYSQLTTATIKSTSKLGPGPTLIIWRQKTKRNKKRYLSAWPHVSTCRDQTCDLLNKLKNPM